MARYKGRKLERARDLFEEALRNCSKSALMQTRLFVLYGKLEERYGLARKAIEVYRRGCDKLAELNKAPAPNGHNISDLSRQLWSLLIVKTGETKGGHVAREVLQAALNTLPEGDALIHFGLLFAELEKNFGELARARVVFEYVSQFCDPRRYGRFWEVWQVFELRHGSAETFREMKRIHRAVQAAFAQVHFNAPDITVQLDEVGGLVALNPQEIAEKSLGNQINGTTSLVDAEHVTTRDKLLEKLGTLQNERDGFFDASDKFVGERVGMVFKMGIKGLGYYDDLQAENWKALKSGVVKRKALTITQEKKSTKPGSEQLESRLEPAMKRAKISKKNAEELDLESDSEEDDDAILKKAETAVSRVPDAVFGGDKVRAEEARENIRKMEQEAVKEGKERDEAFQAAKVQAAKEEAAKEKDLPKKKMGALEKFRKKKGHPP